MQPSLLPIAYANTGYELELMLPEVLGVRPAFGNYNAVAAYYRQLGVADLLLSGDPRGFYEHLFNASRALLHVLSTGDREEFLTSKCAAFLDAVACRDEVGAGSIADLAPSTPDLDREYEEDFLYVRILMNLFVETMPEANPPLLERYETLAEDQDDPRLPVVAALVHRDQDAFDVAVSSAIESFVDAIAAQREEERLDPDEAATTAHVSVELLAWLELASRAGLAVAREYPLAPSLARAFHRVAFPAPDSWKSLSGYA